MKDLENLYIKNEMKRKWFLYIKQLLYLVPIISLILLLSSSQNIKYINQKNFLKSTNYSSINIINDNVGENVFEEYLGEAAVVEDVRGVSVYLKQYKCEIFNIINSKYDWENTYFTSKNMNGYNPADLKEDEVIISYDVSKKLKVKVNDTISLISDDNDLQKQLKIVGIMKTKYCYTEIGGCGTIILKDKNSKALTDLYGEPSYYRFENNQSGDLKKVDELDECNYFRLPAKSVIAVNVVFPLLGIILIIVLISRDIKSIIKNQKYNFAILTSLGLSKKKLNYIIYFLEGIVMLISAIATMIVYKFLLMQKLIGQYVPFSTFVMYFIIIEIIGMVSIYVNLQFTSQELSDSKLLQVLHAKGEME